MKYCNGCSERCKLCYTITDGARHIAPCVGGVTYWVYDIYSSGIQRVLFERVADTATARAHQVTLAVKRAKDIARYCTEQKYQR